MQSPILTSPGRRSAHDHSPSRFFIVVGKILCAAVAILFAQCIEPEKDVKPNTTEEELTEENRKTAADCGCTYTVPANTHRIDGAVL